MKIPKLPCCRRKDAAREVDKAEKYLSSLIFGPLTAGLAIALFVKHTAVHGCLVVGIVALIDFCMGAWVVYTDEWRKDFHKVRWVGGWLTDCCLASNSVMSSLFCNAPRCHGGVLCVQCLPCLRGLLSCACACD